MQTPNVRHHLNRNHLFRVFPPLSLLASSLVQGGGAGGAGGGGGGGGAGGHLHGQGMGTMGASKQLDCSNLFPIFNQKLILAKK